jgi:hypothetical protein
VVVKKIPRDHMGLYACEPLNHGIQQGIRDTHNEVGRDTPLKPRAKCFMTQTAEEYNPDIKTNLMSGKIEGKTNYDKNGSSHVQTTRHGKRDRKNKGSHSVFNSM